MLRKIVPMLALLAAPVIASAQFEAGDLEMTLSGQATAQSPASSGGTVGVNGTLGYFFTKEAEAGIAQSFSYVGGKSKGQAETNGFGGSTFGFGNFHFDLGAWQPYVGAKFGYSYPEFATGQWFIAPVVGVKYFVNGTTFVFADLAYDYDLTAPSNGNSTFEANLGIGFRF